MGAIPACHQLNPALPPAQAVCQGASVAGQPRSTLCPLCQAGHPSSVQGEDMGRPHPDTPLPPSTVRSTQRPRVPQGRSGSWQGCTSSPRALCSSHVYRSQRAGAAQPMYFLEGFQAPRLLCLLQDEELG